MAANGERPLICIGEALVDLICPDPVDDPADARSYRAHFGGALANVAVAASRAGAPAALAGACGVDPWGRFLRERLEREGVLLDFHEGVEGLDTPFAFATLDSRREPHFRIHGDGIDAGIARRVLFLTATEETLMTRYKETRRRHPLAPESGNIVEGIRKEARFLGPVRERADAVVDTTGLSATALRRKIAAEMLSAAVPGKLAVTVTSFGFKHGPARDADLLFDVRFLPNPHYEPDLRPLTGFDQPVVGHIGRDGRLDEFYARLEPLIDYLLPNYVAEGKAHLVVAFGCTLGSETPSVWILKPPALSSPLAKLAAALFAVTLVTSALSLSRKVAREPAALPTFCRFKVALAVRYRSAAGFAGKVALMSYFNTRQTTERVSV